jgi:hypothetical protein
MLKAVVENVQLRVEFLLRDLPGGVTAFANNHGNVQPVRDQQRFITEINGGTVSVDDLHPTAFAPVSAGEHVEGNISRLQEFTERNYEWSLTRSAHR